MTKQETTTPSSTNQQIRISSLEIAKLTGKKHKNVMQDIRCKKDISIQIDGEINVLTSYMDKKGENRYCYELSQTLANVILSKYQSRCKNKNPKYIYILKCNHNYKIGIAVDVTQRLNSCQTGNPYKINLFFKRRVNKPKTIKALLHTLFASKRLEGDWFTMDNEDIKKTVSIINEN